MTDNIYPKTIINTARLARLATVDLECKPHLVPVVYVYDNDRDFYFLPIDEKTKRSRPENLKRVKNIKENPNVALLIDEYNEDWTRLYFIMIQGRASIIGGKKKLDQNEMSLFEKAHDLLRNKYPQYRKIGVGKYVILIKPQKVIAWKNNKVIG
ncbi:MAG TPA: TIGR03668 family PPOX class F420-dependent oxidoreductase [Nitrososphaeraceae archaeon]